MSTGFKDHITADLQKVKQVGGTKVEKIRKIFQDALSQTVTELKEGTGEIRSIAQTSKSTLLDTLKEPQSPTVTPPPVEITIVTDETRIVEESIMDATTQSNHPEPAVEITLNAIDASDPVAAHSVASETVSETVVEVQPEVQPETEATSPGQAEVMAQRLLETLKTLFDRAMNQFKQQEVYGDLQQQATKLKEQAQTLDERLTARYGDRYVRIKQDFQQDAQKAKAWYERTRTNAAETGSYWVDEKQAELHVKAGETGATIAQKEQKIKQLLKELWHTVRQ